MLKGRPQIYTDLRHSSGDAIVGPSSYRYTRYQRSGEK
jgi:hypothetical protein